MSTDIHKAHLSWVRQPIEKSLGRAQTALDSFFELLKLIKSTKTGVQQQWIDSKNREASEKLMVVASEIELVHSAVSAVNSTGSVALTDEMNAICQSILHLDVDETQRDKTLVALMSAIVTLPNYIKMVIDGAPDTPAIVAKTINEIREVRGVPLVVESTSIHGTSFSFVDSPIKDSSTDDEHRKRVFDESSRPFQTAFGNWIGKQDTGSLRQIQEILRNLQVVTNLTEVSCYWWVAELLVDLLLQGGLRHSNNTVTQLRTVSVAIQKAASGGERAAAEALGPERFKNLLYILSMSKVQTEDTEQVLNRFNVSSNVETQSLKKLQEALDRSTDATIETVRAEIDTLLSQAMVSLGRAVAVSSYESFLTQSQSFQAAIKDIANIFFMINDEELCAVANTAAQRLPEGTRREELSDSVIEDLKNDLLYLDARLKNLSENPATKALGIDGVSPDVVANIVKESLTALVSVRRSIALHVDSGEAKTDLVAGLQELVNVAQITSFTGAVAVGSVLHGVATSMLHMVERGELKDGEPYDNAARAVVAVELYLDSINSGFEPDTGLLGQARDALARNGIEVSVTAEPKHRELMSLFNDATKDVTEDDDPLIREMTELRHVFEKFAARTEFSDVDRLQQLHEAADRIAQGAKIAENDSLTKLSSALAIFAQDIHSVSRGESFNLTEVTSLAKEGCNFILRCFDEYSAKGDVQVFVADLAKRLLDVVSFIKDTKESGEILEAEVGVDDVAPGSAGEIILASELSPNEREMPADVDPIVMDLYRAEYRTNHDYLVGRFTSGDLKVNEADCRSAHTLRGCSGSANCLDLMHAFAALEGRLRAIVANQVELSQRDIETALEFLEETLAFHNAFPWQQSTPRAPVWIEIAQSLGCESALNEAEFVEVEAALHEPPVDAFITGHEEAFDEISHLSETVEASSRTSEVVSSTIAEVKQDRTTEVQQLTGYDLEMADFYLEEADERIPQLQENVSEWLHSLNDPELIATIKRQMHTLKGAAAMAALTPIQEVTHFMESLFESVSLNIIPADSSCTELVAEVLHEISVMTSAVRGNRPVVYPLALLHCLQVAVERNSIDLSLLTSCEQLSSPGEAEENLVSTSTKDNESSQCEVSTGQPAAVSVAADDQPGTSPKKKSRRGSRGKGAARRHEERMAAEAVAKSQASDATTGVIMNCSPAVIDEGEAVAKLGAEITDLHQVETTPATVGFDSDNTELPSQIDVVTRLQVSQANVAPAVRRPALITDAEEEVVKPVVSSAIRQFVGRSYQKSSQALDVQRMNTEKIKVDQRLLETAGLQASELTASRHRQLSLSREMMIGLTSVTEQVEGLALQQDQFIQLLRSYLNQPGLRGMGSRQHSLMHLERFNDLSSLAVHSASLMSQVIQDLAYVEETRQLSEDATRRQGKVISSLQHDLIHSRLVPFNNIKPALSSNIDQTSKFANKKVKHLLNGGETMLDKMTLDSLKDTLFHLLNNAIIHGLEDSAERVAAGKPASGQLTISVNRRANNMVVTISDDGRGIDPAIVRAKAVAQGMIRDDDELSEKEIIRLITHSGFSTATKLDRFAGRGVGMDIVKTTVESMRGILEIESVVGKGTTFTIVMPFSLGSNRAMVCSTGGQWFAIPTFSMVQVVSVSRAAIEEQVAAANVAVYEYKGDIYSIVELADLIAMPDLRNESATRKNPDATILLCKHGTTCVGIAVEKADSMPEIHIHELEGILSNVRGVMGETELSDGTAVFVLDVMELVRLNLKQNGQVFSIRQNRIRSAKRDIRPLALVVDDATVYRRILTKYFESRGFEVVQARDGQDALDMLPLDRLPAVISVDLEMPRLDGLGLTQRLRQIEEFNDVPILMVTSRTGAEIQTEATQTGVSAFMNKPFDAASLDLLIKGLNPNLISSEAAA